MRTQKCIKRKEVRPRTGHDIVHSSATLLASRHFVEFPTIRHSEVFELPHDVFPCLVLCGTLQNRLLSDDGHRRITQRIDVDGAAYRLHGQKLAGRASKWFRMPDWHWTLPLIWTAFIRKTAGHPIFKICAAEAVVQLECG